MPTVSASNESRVEGTSDESLGTAVESRAAESGAVEPRAVESRPDESRAVESRAVESRAVVPSDLSLVATEGTLKESAPPLLSGKRRRGISATTKSMTKSSRNMSVFLLTAAKVAFFNEK